MGIGPEAHSFSIKVEAKCAVLGAQLGAVEAMRNCSC